MRNPLSDYKILFNQILNYKMVEMGCYLNLPNEEWACKIMVNVINNSGFEGVKEELTHKYVEALKVY